MFPLNDDPRLNVHSGKEIPVRVGQVDLGAERAVLGIERSSVPRHFGLDDLPAGPLEFERDRITVLDPRGIGAGHVDEDAHRIDLFDDKECLAPRSAGSRLHKVAGVDVPVRHDSVERSADRGVVAAWFSRKPGRPWPTSCCAVANLTSALAFSKRGPCGFIAQSRLIHVFLVQNA